MTIATENIKVRKVDFDVKNIKRHYAANNIFATHFLNAMHIVFPEGEKFFIRSARHYLTEIKDDTDLVERVKRFIGQEGVHNKEHQKFWDILDEMGLKPYPFAKFYSRTAYKYWENGFLGLFGKKRKALLSLSVTSALEHFTALLGDGALKENPFGELPKNVWAMLQWHAAEELEHKSVCFDLYEKVGGDYPTRVAGMLMASFLLWVYIFGGQIYFIANDKEKDLSSLPKEFFEFWRLLLQSKAIRNLFKMYLDYYKVGFHPDDHENYGLAENFFKEHKAYFEEMGVAV